MSEKISFPADAKVSGAIWELYGLVRGFEALGGDKAKSQLPGFGLARALIEKELADARAVMSGAVYRCAARAGHDIAKCGSIITTIKDGKPHLEIEMLDLADLAEAGAAHE